MDENKENLICKLYKEGIKNSDICKQCHCSTNTISKIIDKYNIPRRAVRKTNKDFTKFYNLDNPETQYWIGYICADGNIEYNKNYRVYKVSLFSKEEEPIDKFIKFFGENNVSKNKRATGIIEAYINPKELCEYFINNLNIVPNKSLTLNPNIKFTNNFILGYFDGDGCIRNSKKGHIHHECGIACGSKVFLDKIKEIIDKNDIYSIIRKHDDCNAYELTINRKIDSEKFYNFLYKDMVVCLSRKLNNFVALYGNIENNNRVNCGNIIGESATKQKQQNVFESSTTNA